MTTWPVAVHRKFYGETPEEAAARALKKAQRKADDKVVLTENGSGSDA